jgi:hypothetical protein
MLIISLISWGEGWVGTYQFPSIVDLGPRMLCVMYHPLPLSIYLSEVMGRECKTIFFDNPVDQLFLPLVPFDIDGLTLLVRPPPTALLILAQEDPWPVSLPYFLTAAHNAVSSSGVQGLREVEVGSREGPPN